MAYFLHLFLLKTIFRFIKYDDTNVVAKKTYIYTWIKL